jgi:hypothetical protein
MGTDERGWGDGLEKRSRLSAWIREIRGTLLWQEPVGESGNNREGTSHRCEELRRVSAGEGDRTGWTRRQLA